MLNILLTQYFSAIQEAEDALQFQNTMNEDEKEWWNDLLWTNIRKVCIHWHALNGYDLITIAQHFHMTEAEVRKLIHRS